MTLTTGEYLKARRLLRERKSWSVVAKELGRPLNQVRRALDQDWAEKRRNLVYRWRHRKKEATERKSPPDNEHGLRGHPMTIPADVLADRERRMMLEPRPFGDPPFGCSALDKRLNGG